MSAQEVQYIQAVFFECYKIIENIHSIGSWCFVFDTNILVVS